VENLGGPRILGKHMHGIFENKRVANESDFPRWSWSR